VDTSPGAWTFFTEDISKIILIFIISDEPIFNKYLHFSDDHFSTVCRYIGKM
jgi:hypothetical protein